MKQSQLKQIIRQIIKEQGIGTSSGPTSQFPGQTPYVTPGPNESPCCNAIQQLKPFIPVAEKTKYLKALDKCGCNTGALGYGGIPSDPQPFITPDN